MITALRHPGDRKGHPYRGALTDRASVHVSF